MSPEERYLERMARIATGEASAESTADLLYPDARPSDVRRLAMHERYGHWYRGSALETHFPECRAQILAQRGEATWRALVADYFRTNAPRQLPMHKNAARFPGFLAARSSGAELAAWVAEIADLEWLEWLVTSLPEAPPDRDDSGPLRVTAALHERVYKHDLVAWLDGADRTERGDGPPDEASLIVVWRDRSLVAQRGSFGRLDHAILRAVRSGADAAHLARETGGSAPQVTAAVHELHWLGVLRGELSA